MPLKYIDMIRHSNTIFDNFEGSGIDDHWNLEGNTTNSLCTLDRIHAVPCSKETCCESPHMGELKIHQSPANFQARPHKASIVGHV